MSGGPGPLTRTGSRRDARRDAAAPYLSRRSSSRLAVDTSGTASSGLTKYVGDVSLGFGDDAMDEGGDAVPALGSKAAKKDVPRTT